MDDDSSVSIPKILFSEAEKEEWTAPLISAATCTDKESDASKKSFIMLFISRLYV